MATTRGPLLFRSGVEHGGQRTGERPHPANVRLDIVGMKGDVERLHLDVDESGSTEQGGEVFGIAQREDATRADRWSAADEAVRHGGHADDRHPRVRIERGPGHDPDSPAGVEDAADLGERHARVGHEHQAHAAGHHVERLRGAVDLRRVERHDRDVRERGGSTASHLDHARRDIAQDDRARRPDPCRPLGAEASRPRRELEDSLTWLRRDPAQQRLGGGDRVPVDLVDLGVPRSGDRTPVLRGVTHRRHGCLLAVQDVPSSPTQSNTVMV